MAIHENYWSEELGQYGEPGWRWFLIGPCEPIIRNGLDWCVLALVFNPSGHPGKWFYDRCLKPGSIRDHVGPFATAQEAMACYGQNVEIRVPEPKPAPNPYADLPLFAQVTT